MPELFASFSELKDAVKVQRDVAHAESIQSCGRKGFHRSRGIEFSVIQRGDKVSETGTLYWGGTKKELQATLKELLHRYPGADEIHLDGGFDYAKGMRDFDDGSYDPWVSDWSVLIWQREPLTPDRSSAA